MDHSTFYKTHPDVVSTATGDEIVLLSFKTDTYYGLTSHGIESRLAIGVPHQKGARFEAHAWLLSHGITVTGGNVARYNAFPAA